MNKTEYTNKYNEIEHKISILKKEQQNLFDMYLKSSGFLPFNVGDFVYDKITGDNYEFNLWETSTRNPNNHIFPQLTYYFTKVDSQLKRLDAGLMLRCSEDLTRFVKINAEKVMDPRKYLYCIRMKNTNCYKIGIATNMASRMSSHQTSNPNELTVVASVQVDFPRKTEKEIHRYLRDKRQKGEWFLLTSSDVEDVLTKYFYSHVSLVGI